MNNDTWRLPAEWEPQSGVQLTWPHEDTDWYPYLNEATETFVELATAIARREKLLIVAPNLTQVKPLLEQHIDPIYHANLRYAQCPSNDTWARDHGPLTLLSATGSKLIDFRFNGWGEKFAWQKDNLVTRNLYAKRCFNGLIERQDNFVLEGGAIESDGKGTLLTTSQCLLAPHRNQPMNKAELTQQLLQTLHAKRVLWLDYGHLIGDDTDGHIDTLVRMAPNDTLLYIKCTDKDDPQYQELLLMEEQLATLSNAEGKPYRLVSLPLPDAIMFEGERLPATYANFVVLNGAVICPVYGQKNKDQEALQTLSEAFPTRKIIGIDARIIIRQHGSLHCLTMQYPQGVMI